MGKIRSHPLNKLAVINLISHLKIFISSIYTLAVSDAMVSFEQDDKTKMEFKVQLLLMIKIESRRQDIVVSHLEA